MRDDFLRHLARVLPKRRVVFCTASEPLGRFQQCLPRLRADSPETLKDELSSLLGQAFADLGLDQMPPVYPSFHYAVGRHWRGGRDLVVEADADDWRVAWEAMEPVAAAMEALGVPFTLRYSGHVSPHLCVAEEQFPEPKTFPEAVRRAEELRVGIGRRCSKHGVQPAPMIARVPYSLNENTGLACIELRRQHYGSFEPSLADPRHVTVMSEWPPQHRGDRGLEVIAWLRGLRDVEPAPMPLFARSAAAAPSPSPTLRTADLEAEFHELRRALTPKVRASDAAAQTARAPQGMIYIPAGRFIAGSPFSVKELGKPVMSVARSRALVMDVCPVTNTAYREFMANGGYEREELWSREGWRFVKACGWQGPLDPCQYDPGNFPVRGVSYFEAEAYARWRGKRLPSLREWEKACRGVDGRRWPWGDDFDAARCNTADRHNSDADWQPTPVGSFPTGASPYGCLDLVGNVWEWVRGALCIGGSFVSHLRESHGCEGHGQEPSLRSHKIGFRCAGDVR